MSSSREKQTGEGGLDTLIFRYRICNKRKKNDKGSVDKEEKAKNIVFLYVSLYVQAVSGAKKGKRIDTKILAQFCLHGEGMSSGHAGIARGRFAFGRIR